MTSGKMRLPKQGTILDSANEWGRTWARSSL